MFCALLKRSISSKLIEPENPSELLTFSDICVKLELYIIFSD